MINIYDKIKIIYDEKREEFGVMNIVDIQCWFTIATTSNLEVAEQIKKAYCDGYYDGYHTKEKNRIVDSEDFEELEEKLEKLEVEDGKNKFE